MTGAEQWRELKPRLGRRVEGLIGSVPVLENGATLFAGDDPPRITGPGVPWSYLARFRLRPGVIEPSHWTAPLVLRVTATAVRGRVGAICVGDDLQTLLGSSVEWTEDDGERTLSFVVYTYPGQGWLVFRNTAVASPEVGFRVSAVEVFTLHADHQRLDGAGGQDGGRAVIYTAITNRYDTLKSPRRLEPDCDYVCFTDESDAVAPPWETVRISGTFRDPRMAARWYKVHPHVLFPSHALSIWIDGRIELRREMLPLARAALGGTSLAVFDNPWYQCVYLDAESVTREGRDARDIVDQQIARYHRSGLPRHLGNLSTGVTIRRHHDVDVIRAMTAWWDELERGSHRDQMSLAYVLWHHRLPFRRIWLPIYDNPYFGLGKHNFVDYYRV